MKQLRERAGLSQSALAKQLNLTASAISKWDQGIAFPRLMPAEMAQLRTVLNCTENELIEAQRTWEASKRETP